MPIVSSEIMKIVDEREMPKTTKNKNKKDGKGQGEQKLYRRGDS